MARLEFITPLRGASRAEAERIRGDGRTHVTKDAGEEFHYFVLGDTSVTPEGDERRTDALYVDITYSARGYVDEAVLTVATDPSADIVQRFNRLLKGTGVELFWYHRAGRVQFHTPGAWHDLPVQVRLSNLSADTGDPDSWLLQWKPLDDDRYETVSSKRPSRTGSPKVVRPAVARAAAKPVPSTVTAPLPAAEPQPEPEVKAAPKVAPVKGDPSGLFKFPVLSKGSEVIVKADIAAGLDVLWSLHTQGHRQVLAMVGPTGTGKTSLAYNLAAKHNIGVFTFDAAGAREFSDWVGMTHLNEGKTEFVQSGFLRAIDADGPYGGQDRIVLIDEVNRAESSGALNALIPVLHGFGTLYVPELGRGVNIDPTAMVILTANRGSQYAGTVGLDLALADRVTAWVQMDYIEAAAEVELVTERTGLSREKVQRLAQAAAQVRLASERGELPEGGGISTRRILLAAEKAVGGMSLHSAATWTWLGAYSAEGGSSSEQQVVRSVIDGTLRGW